MTLGFHYHVVVVRSLIVLLFIVGFVAVYFVWAIRQPVHLVLVVADWIEDRLIDIEESVYEHAWVARGRLPPWKDE